MAVNDMSFEQSATMLNALVEQATGQKPTIEVTDTGTFTTVAQTLLKTGYDPVLGALSQVLGRTIFSIRPYTQKFRGIDVDAERWAAHVRKVNFVSSQLEDDERLASLGTPPEVMKDGESVDMYKIKKPKILQTNFYGATEYQEHVTVFRDQLDVAFRDPEEFGHFVSGVMQTIKDDLTQTRESEARAALINLATGKQAGDSANVINVLQAYKDETGTSLTPENMYSDANYMPFIKWLYAFINTLTDRMVERTTKYHVNVTDKPIRRHTPADRMKAYMYNGVLNKIDSAVLSSVFNDDKLKMIDFESVTFWQNINEPTKMLAKPTFLKADGSLETASADVALDNVLGIFFDEEAVGITTKSTWMDRTPFNSAGGYSNVYWHHRQAVWNDFSENCVVLTAATPTRSRS